MKKINEWTITDKTTPDGATVIETTRKHRYVECRKMSVEAFAELCEKFGWYNCGINNDYKDNYKETYNRIVNSTYITIDDIIEIATDIVEHTQLDYNDFDYVSSELMGICWSYLKEVGDAEPVSGKAEMTLDKENDMINNIKTYRTKAGIKQKELSELTGIRSNKISEYENLKSLDNITIGTLRKLSKALNVTINDLVYSLSETN